MCYVEELYCLGQGGSFLVSRSSQQKEKNAWLVPLPCHVGSSVLLGATEACDKPVRNKGADAANGVDGLKGVGWNGWQSTVCVSFAHYKEILRSLNKVTAKAAQQSFCSEQDGEQDNQLLHLAILKYLANLGEETTFSCHEVWDPRTCGWNRFARFSRACGRPSMNGVATALSQYTKFQELQEGHWQDSVSCTQQAHWLNVWIVSSSQFHSPCSKRIAQKPD